MSNISLGLVSQGPRNARVTLYINGFAPIVDGGKTRYPRISVTVGYVDPKNWDPIRMRPKPAHNRLDGGMLGKEIDILTSQAHQAYHMAPLKTVEAVQTILDELRGLKPVVKLAARTLSSKLLVDLYCDWIANGESQPKQKGGLDHKTIKQYRSFITKVEEYEKAVGHQVDMATIDQAELESIIKWMAATYRLAPNSIWGRQKNLNKAINWSRSVEGLQRTDIKPIHTQKIATGKKEILDWSDLHKVINYQAQGKLMQDAQTITVAMALTSIRIGDLWNLFDNIAVRNGVLCSQFECDKDPHPTISPIIFEPVRKLIRQHGMPKKRNETTIREAVQSLIRTAGVNKHVELHSLRRSFVSNFLSLGVIPDYLLAKVFTGHSLRSGDRGVFHSYNHAAIVSAQRSILSLLTMADREIMSGVQLFGPGHRIMQLDEAA